MAVMLTETLGTGVPILQTKKLRSREVKQLVQGHGAIEGLPHQTVIL